MKVLVVFVALIATTAAMVTPSKFKRNGQTRQEFGSVGLANSDQMLDFHADKNDHFGMPDTSNFAQFGHGFHRSFSENDHFGGNQFQIQHPADFKDFSKSKQQIDGHPIHNFDESHFNGIFSDTNDVKQPSVNPQQKSFPEHFNQPIHDTIQPIRGVHQPTGQLNSIHKPVAQTQQSIHASRTPTHAKEYGFERPVHTAVPSIHPIDAHFQHPVVSGTKLDLNLHEPVHIDQSKSSPLGNSSSLVHSQIQPVESVNKITGDVPVKAKESVQQSTPSSLPAESVTNNRNTIGQAPQEDQGTNNRDGFTVVTSTTPSSQKSIQESKAVSQGHGVIPLTHNNGPLLQVVSHQAPSAIIFPAKTKGSTPERPTNRISAQPASLDVENSASLGTTTETPDSDTRTAASLNTISQGVTPVIPIRNNIPVGSGNSGYFQNIDDNAYESNERYPIQQGRSKSSGSDVPKSEIKLPTVKEIHSGIPNPKVFQQSIDPNLQLNQPTKDITVVLQPLKTEDHFDTVDNKGFSAGQKRQPGFKGSRDSGLFRNPEFFDINSSLPRRQFRKNSCPTLVDPSAAYKPSSVVSNSSLPVGFTQELARRPELAAIMKRSDNMPFIPNTIPGNDIICPSTRSTLTTFRLFGSTCYVPSSEHITFVTCGSSSCNQCASTTGVQGMCVPQYELMSMYAYCENAPGKNKINRETIPVPRSCGCKMVQCTKQ